MNPFTLLPCTLSLVLTLALTACSTTESRLRESEAQVTRDEQAALQGAKTQTERQDVVEEHDTARRMLRSGRSD